MRAVTGGSLRPGTLLAVLAGIVIASCATERTEVRLGTMAGLGRNEGELLRVRKDDFADPANPARVKATSDGSKLLRDLVQASATIRDHIRSHGVPDFVCWEQEAWFRRTYDFYYLDKDRRFRFRENGLKPALRGVRVDEAQDEPIPETERRLMELRTSAEAPSGAEKMTPSSGETPRRAGEEGALGTADEDEKPSGGEGIAR